MYKFKLCNLVGGRKIFELVDPIQKPKLTVFGSDDDLHSTLKTSATSRCSHKSN